MGVRLLYLSFTLISIAINFTASYVMNIGAVPFEMLPVKDDDPNKVFIVSFDFYNRIFMQPWYWFGMYAFGTFTG